MLHEDFVVQLLINPQPDLLRAKKQIRSEALPIYYGEDQFFMSINAPDSCYGTRKPITLDTQKRDVVMPRALPWLTPICVL